MGNLAGQGAIPDHEHGRHWVYDTCALTDASEQALLEHIDWMQSRIAKD